MAIQTLDELETFLNEIYQPGQIQDYGPQGLIVGGNSRLKKGCTAVSLTLEVVRKAILAQADFLIVHHAHGFWKDDTRRIRGAHLEKLQGLLLNGISLFGFHLPMDVHPDLGNNIQILKALGLKEEGVFHKIGDFYLGRLGGFENSMKFDDFCDLVEERIGALKFKLPFGGAQISRVAVCSGGGSSLLPEAKSCGADIFLTGEIKETSFVYCQDEGFNCLAAGHYSTETFGPKAIAKYLTEKQGLSTSFIESLGPV